MWDFFSRNRLFSITVVFTALSVVMVGVCGYLIWNWSYEIGNVRAVKNSEELMLNSFQEQLKLYKSGFDEKAAQLFRVRPAEDRIVDLLNAMDRLAAKTGVVNFSLQNIENDSAISEEKNEEKRSISEFPAVGYMCRFEATPQNFRGFLKGFDALPYYFEITDFSIQQKGGVSLSEFFDVTLTFYIFTR